MYVKVCVLISWPTPLHNTNNLILRHILPYLSKPDIIL